MERNELLKAIKDEKDCLDLVGFFERKDGSWLFDRRYTIEGMERLGLCARTADLNLIGEAIVNMTALEMQQIIDD